MQNISKGKHVHLNYNHETFIASASTKSTTHIKFTFELYQMV